MFRIWRKRRWNLITGTLFWSLNVNVDAFPVFTEFWCNPENICSWRWTLDCLNCWQAAGTAPWTPTGTAPSAAPGSAETPAKAAWRPLTCCPARPCRSTAWTSSDSVWSAALTERPFLSTDVSRFKKKKKSLLWGKKTF